MTDSERIADVLWYLKGYVDASEHAASPCMFDKGHIESLNVALHTLQDSEAEEERPRTQVGSDCICARGTPFEEGEHHLCSCPRYSEPSPPF